MLPALGQTGNTPPLPSSFQNELDTDREKVTLLQQQCYRQTELLREQSAQQFELLRQQQATATGSTHTSTRNTEHLQVQWSWWRLSAEMVCRTGWCHKGSSHHRFQISSIELGRTYKDMDLKPQATRPIRIRVVRILEIPAQTNVPAAARWGQDSLELLKLK